MAADRLNQDELAPEHGLNPFLDEVERFERAVFEQRPVDAGHYNQEYFASDWRATTIATTSRRGGASRPGTPS